MEPKTRALLGLGLLTLLITWLPTWLRRVPLTLPILCVGLGYVTGELHVAPIHVKHTSDLRSFTEITAEVVLLVALLGAGLKIDRRVGLRAWSSTWRLLGLAMPATIGALALAAVAIGGFPWASALLIGAALAPTDPVLASAVGAGAPGKGEEGEVRFALSSEAGLNDGLAFPFVLLAMALSRGESVGAGWLASHFLWKPVIALVIGWVFGRAVGFLVFERRVLRVSEEGQGLIALGTALVTFGLAEAAGGYGFITVFVTAVTLRWTCPESELHGQMWGFAVQIEELLAMLLIYLFGFALSVGLLGALTWPDAIVALGSIFFVRPLTAWAALWRTPHPAISRAFTSFFGLRGIGTIFYMIHALTRADFPDAARIAALISFTVLCSIVIHGALSTPIMRHLDRVRRELVGRRTRTEEEPVQGAEVLGSRRAADES